MFSSFCIYLFRLRVADCSIVPQPITAHTNAVSFMIGEKLADILKAKWNRQQIVALA